MNTRQSTLLRILLVEDNEYDFMAFRRTLKNSEISCKITLYIKAEEALKRLSKDAASFDLIVSDYSLPSMSGLDLCKEIINRNIALPTVLLTGQGAETLAVEALKAGVNDYLMKDFEGNYLKLLPVILPDVVKKHNDRAARKKAEKALQESIIKYEQKQKELQKANDKLEQRVEHRTAMLEIINSALKKQITQRKRVEKFLRKSEEKFSNAFQFNPDCVIITRFSDGKIIEANDNFLHKMGYNKDEVVGESAVKLKRWANPEDRKIFIKKLQKKGECIDFESKLCLKNGKIIDALTSAQRIEVEGEPCIISIIRDVTEIKRTENELQKYREQLEYLVKERTEELTTINEQLQDEVTERSKIQERFKYTLAQQRVIMDNTALGIVFLKQRKFICINKRMEDLFGYPQEELIGKTTEIIYPSHAIYQQTGNEIYPIIETGKTCAVERMMKHKNSSLFWCSIVGKAINIKDRTQGSIWMYEDITKRKLAEEELKKAKKIAENAAKTKSDFLAAMSHEIRTPMNGVIGMTGFLLNTKLTHEQRKFAEIIQISGESLLTIINDILDFSKIEAGKMELEEHPFELEACVKEVCKLLSLKASEKGIDLKYSIDQKVPPFIKGDITRIRQILFNLVGNSLRFTKEGEIVVSIKKVESLDSSDSEIQLVFSVSDTGIGIPRDKIDQLFKAFSQVDASTTRKYGGTGLGLAICSQLVQLMRGKIWVESIPGNGSIFFFTIITNPASAIPEEAANQVIIDPQMSVHHPLNVLVAEDNIINQMVAEYMLAQIGYNGDIVNNGAEALQKLKQQFYDVILMDIMMPEMDGLEATRHIRDDWPKEQQPRIIAMTADALAGKKEEYLKMGMDDYISKPVQIEDLVKALNISHQLIEKKNKDWSS
ncbi:two-component system, sensor histidine kinase [Candidatus Magnetomoraceae bacterium gMMP-15]